MATPSASRRSAPVSINRPRWSGPPIVIPDAAALDTIVKSFGTIEDVCAFIKSFVAKRAKVTGWVAIADVTSTDSRKPSPDKGKTPGEQLDARFPSLTGTIAGAVVAKGGPELPLQQTLGAFAALMMSYGMALQANGITLQPTQGYSGRPTFKLTANGGARPVPEDAATLAAELLTT